MFDSIINIIETKELNEKSDKTEKPEDAAAIIKQYEDIICTQKTSYPSRIIKEKFSKIVNEFKVHKSTIIFKINIVKLLDKHHKLRKSSVTLGFLKNYHKNIKYICNENSNEFVITLQNSSDAFYSKCCKIFKAYLTIMHYRVNFARKVVEAFLLIIAN